MQQGKNIEAITLEELFKQDSPTSINILVKIKHPDIIWKDGTEGGQQKNGQLCLINGTIPVMYKGEKYYPSCFSFEQPTEDGTKIGNTNITVSAIDQRIVEIIRSIKSNPIAEIVAVFNFVDTEHTKVRFSQLYNYEFEMSNAQWDGVTAKWNLTFDPAMQQNIPMDKAVESRCPSAYEQTT